MTIQDIGHDLEIEYVKDRLLSSSWIAGTLHGYRFQALVFNGTGPDRWLAAGHVPTLTVKKQSSRSLVCNFVDDWLTKPPIDSDAAEIVAFLETGLVDFVMGEVE